MISGSSKDALLKVLKNTRAKKAEQHEELVLRELDRRFPGWETATRARSGGRTPNLAIFEGRKQQFGTAKEGFSWLAAQMIDRAERGSGISDERLEIASSERRKYLAHSPEDLFSSSPHLAEDSNNYVKMPLGWYRNVNLPNKDKFDVLARFAWIASMKHPDDWDWIVDANTEDFVKRRERQAESERIHTLFDDILKDVLETKAKT